MDSRLELHDELLTFLPNVYFQPPANIKMTYPCIVYNKTTKSRRFASNHIYFSRQEYDVTVMDKNPDSTVADNIEEHFQYCIVANHYTVDNLNHAKLNLYY